MYDTLKYAAQGTQDLPSHNVFGYGDKEGHDREV